MTEQFNFFRQYQSNKMSFRELVRFEVNYHLFHPHENKYDHILGPNTTWIRQPENQLTRVNNTHCLSLNLKEKFLKAKPDSRGEDITVTRIEIKGCPLFDHELNCAPLGLLQTDDVVDVYLMINDHNSQPLLVSEGEEEETSSERETQAFVDSQKLEEESQDLLAPQSKKSRR